MSTEEVMVSGGGGSLSLPRLLRSLSSSSSTVGSSRGRASLDPERSSGGGSVVEMQEGDHDEGGIVALPSRCNYYYAQQQPQYFQNNLSVLDDQRQPPPTRATMEAASTLLDELLLHCSADASSSTTAARFRSPVSLISNIFTCWCKHRPSSSSSSASLRRHRDFPGLRRFAAAALLEQNRLQQEALLESQDTRDMWEWQMERQRFLTSQERDLLERSSGCGVDITSLLAIANAAAVAPPDQLFRNASVRSERAAAIGTPPPPKSLSSEAKSNNSPRSSSGCSLDASMAWEMGSPSDAAIALLFEATLLRCHSEINFFCRVVMQKMVLCGYSLIRTLKEMEPNAMFANKLHSGYALESRIYAAFFRCFENDSFDETGLTRIFDPAQRAAARLHEYMKMRGLDAEEAMDPSHAHYDLSFHAFCADKSEELTAMFSWSNSNGGDDQRFTEAFLRASKWVWLLHRLAYATDPPAQIIRVGRGQEVDPLYLEPLNAGGGVGSSCHKCIVTVGGSAKVEFMVMPGFITSHKIFHCKVFQRQDVDPAPMATPPS